MKTSDEKLVQQIKSVFEDYNDGLGEQGWAELRKKYPERENKKLPIWWLTGIAATLLVVVGLYFNNSVDTEKVILRANTSQIDSSIKQNTENSDNIEVDLAKTSKPSATENTQKIAPTENKVLRESVENINSVAQTEQFIAVQNKPASDFKNITEKPNQITTENQSKTSTVIDNNTVITSAQTDGGNTGKNPIDNAIATIQKDNKPNNETKPTKLTTEEFLTEQSKIIASNENKKDKKNGASKTTIDVFTGTFFNYHDDNEAKLSAGVGLNANVKVAKNVILSLGAGISQNKVNYENKVPAQVSEAMFAAKNNALNDAPVSGMSYSATATNDLSFNGSMLSIDLPMVVKLYPTNKQDFYISTGINSSTYLSQKYTYNYSLSNFAVQNGTAQPQKQTEKSNFGGFDFANSAIFAIGINQNIGKNILIFEPYYKPALNTMGDKNLRISSAGINLKFNFNGNAKK